MQLLNRLFSLRSGEFTRGLPLFVYYFLIIGFYVLGRVARDAIFLDRIDAKLLPYGDIAIAALSWLFISVYIRASRRVNLAALQVSSLVAFAVSLPVMWVFLHLERAAWVAPVFYVWVGVCGILCVSQVWTLANFVWTTREAKRLFGPLGSSAIAGGIVAGFGGKWLVDQVGTDAVLLVMAAMLAMCAALVVVTWRRRGANAAGAQTAAPAAATQQARNVRESFRLVRQSRHLTAIAVLICLGSIVTTAAGWQFKAISKHALVDKDAMAAFFSLYYGYTGLASLVLQSVLTAKLLRYFGIGVTLLILPAFLTMGTVGVLLVGSLTAATVLKGSDAVIRYSIDTSALQLLYLPVPAGIKVQVKSFIDTVIWKLGDGLAGLTLLLFATYLQFSARQISWVTLVLLGAWIAAAVYARRQYVATLRRNMQQVAIEPEHVLVPTLDQATTNVFAEKLGSPDPKDVLYALALFEMGQRRQSHHAVRKLLSHPSAEVRARAIAILNEGGDTTVRQPVTALLRDEDLGVRTEALRFLTRHDRIDPLLQIERLGDVAGPALRSATVAFLARPGEGQNLEAAGVILDGMVGESGDAGREARLEAARLLALLPDRFDAALDRLLQDPDVAVRREALASTAALRRRRFVPRLIALLADPDLGVEAAEALVQFDDGIVGTLRDHLNDAREAMAVRLTIPQVLHAIGTPTAASALGDALLQADRTLRFRVIKALNKLQETSRDLRLDRQMVDTVMIAELMGHYRSYQILGNLGGTPDAALTAAMQHEVERIFRLMKLLFPSLELKEAYTAILSADMVTHANALEFLDNTLSPQLRSLLVPLLDSEVTVPERVKLADRFLGFSVPAPPAR